MDLELQSLLAEYGFLCEHALSIDLPVCAAMWSEQAFQLVSDCQYGMSL